MDLELSPEYAAAIAAHNSALAKYRKAVDAYRAKLIGDGEFLYARGLRVKADEAFDLAFELERARGAAEMIDGNIPASWSAA